MPEDLSLLVGVGEVIYAGRAFRAATIARRVGRLYLAEKFGTPEVDAAGRNALGRFERISGVRKASTFIGTTAGDITQSSVRAFALGAAPSFWAYAKAYGTSLVPVVNAVTATVDAVHACRQ